jgi:thymidylate kinase
VAYSDPSGVYIKTPSGLFARIRDNVDTDLRETSPSAHFLYYLASLVETSCEIVQVLDSGRNVYCDRFLIDTVVSHRAVGLDVDLCYGTKIFRLPVPDLTFLIHADEEIRQARIQGRGKSNLDCTLDSHGLRERFRVEFERLSDYLIEVNNNERSPLNAIEQVQRHIKELLKV